MNRIPNYTFNPGPRGQGTITIPGTLALEDIGLIVNVTRNAVIYDPVQSQAGATVSYSGGSTVITLEQQTSFCKSTDKLQILATIYGESSTSSNVTVVNSLPIPVDIGGNGTITITSGTVTVQNEVEIKNESGNPVPVSGPLTDSQLRASAVPVAPNITRGSGTIDINTTRVSLASDDLTVSTLTSINNRQAVPRTPTTTSVSSTTSSTLLLAANTNRRGLSIANDSTATLRLSFSNPATTANAFLVMAPNSFLMLDQQLIITNVIYGLWTSANGTAQITEFV